jgi:uncharacterized protein YjbJ (UPF0337 family)
MADENMAKSSAKNLGGKMQDEAGNVTGDTATQAKEMVNEAAGNAQDVFASIKAAACRWSGTAAGATKERPLTALLVAISAGYVLHMMTRKRGG